MATSFLSILGLSFASPTTPTSITIVSNPSFSIISFMNLNSSPLVSKVPNIIIFLFNLYPPFIIINLIGYTNYKSNYHANPKSCYLNILRSIFLEINTYGNFFLIVFLVEIFFPAKLLNDLPFSPYIKFFHFVI
ncbi:hypothetical protein CTC_01795 [Clostridium tetani E88]|uniref:Uncharacterized protein n=1 Tax=Clostridium tetani (strain Massachusetts / E88) TaxID=212717 RepID=Q893M1_CLOTE|nr:hypothetical protein CTC_01795 [Clostridium tetani E88]